MTPTPLLNLLASSPLTCNIPTPHIPLPFLYLASFSAIGPLLPLNSPLIPFLLLRHGLLTGTLLRQLAPPEY